MNCFYVYILHSQQAEKYHTGHSQYLGKRRRQHQYKHAHWTGQASDWTEVWHTEVATRQEAADLERRIKRRGAKRFIEGIKKA
jgi:putative endonuclease